MDGVGVGPADAGDAVVLANTPTLDQMKTQALYAELNAHGTAVGLPSDKDMGNSEVGHNTIGGGRVFDQGAKLVDQAIGSGAMFRSAAWRDTVAQGTLHFIGLLSDGNVHSHERHLHAMLRQAKTDGVERVRVHILLDGRDVGPCSALTYVNRLEHVLSELSDDYCIASGGGRMVVTMDRYGADWNIVARGWQTHVHADARRFPTAKTAIETLRNESPGIIDQYLPPFTVAPGSPIADGDGVILFNFRGDRAMEIARAFDEKEFSHFDRGRKPDCRFVGMMEYDGDLHVPTHYLVEPPEIDLTFGEYLVRNQVNQWACSETQKFGHVTYFWNGNRTGAFDEAYEKYVEIESDRVMFDQKPEMKAREITDETIRAIQSGQWQLLRINYANGDMVGHTGNLPAAIQAMEFVDKQLSRLVQAVSQANGMLIVTADHGNCDEMFVHDKAGQFKLDSDGQRQACTSHSLSRVPFYLLGAPDGTKLHNTGGLSNVASTTLNLLGYQAPHDYEKTLIILP